MSTAASTHNRLSDESERVISCATSVEEIISELAKRGCPDLTALINSDARSQFAVAGGGFCDVYSGALRDGTKIAIKSLRVYEDAYGDGNKKKILKHSARELYHWSKLRHPNVLPLMGLANFQDRISMISKWVNNGNLTSFLQRHPDANRLSLCMDVCAGLRYIHNDGMVHGDLKGANVMVSSDGVAMITDFGNANLKDITLRFTNTGKPAYSLRWAAPELMGDDTRPNTESDVYAYGMTALEVLTGKVPYEEVRDMQLSNTFATGWRSPLRPEIGIDDILWQILEGCWSQKPADRPTIDTVMNQLLLFDPTLINPNGEDLSVSRLPSEIIAVFNTYGYMNLTQSLALRDCSRRPCFSDTGRDVFSGMLRDSTRVAINVIRGIHQETISPATIQKHAIALQTWSKCNHPNVARIMGFAEFQGRAAIISYWVEHRSIHAYIVSNPSADRCSLSRSLSEGLAYLHANSIVYGNLTGASVSVAGNDVAVLAEPDGDLADSRPPTDQPAPVNFPSARWTAPEILKSNTAYTYASDVYALGMTILEIITGRIPFAEIADTDIYEAVVIGKQKPPRPEECIPSQSVYGNIFWAALTRCWSRNSRLRSSAAEVKEIMKLLTREGLEVVEDEDNSE